MIRFACPTCAKVMSMPERAGGLKGRCPHCGQRLQIPDPLQRTVLGRFLPPAPRRAAVAPPPVPDEPEYALSAAEPGRRGVGFWALLLGLALLGPCVVVGVVLLLWSLFSPPTPKPADAPPRAVTPHDADESESEGELVRQVAAHPFWERRPTARQVDELADLATTLNATDVLYVDDDFQQTPVVDDEPFLRTFRAKKAKGGGYVPEGVKRRCVAIDLSAWPTRPTRREVLMELLSSLDRAGQGNGD